MKEITLLIDWILNSGLQNDNMGLEVNGGFNSWYNLTTKEYPYIYSEITGYGITTLLYLNSIESSKHLIERSKLAADWIINNAMLEDGAILTRKFYDKKLNMDNYSFERGIVFTFDCGMVLFGISNLFESTKEEKYLDASKRIADFILSMQKENGEIYAFYNSNIKTKGDETDKWSNQSGAFHAKVAMGLLKTFFISGDEKYKNGALEILGTIERFQDNNGRFITNRFDNTTLQHPHSYTIEGLLYCGIKLNKKKYIKMAIDAINWSFGSQMENGGIPQIYHPKQGFNKHERTDILSQVLRFGCLINSHMNEEIINNSKIDALKNRLLEFQFVDENDITQKGGLLYGLDDTGKKYNDLNSWCSMFALQALYYYRNYKNNKEINIDLLI